MNAVGKALWFVEAHLGDDLSLETVAERSGVSPYHLTRAFASATGRSLMRYVRSRRLSEAARTLSQGAPNILGVALAAGYGSHEAFSRAFRDQFGTTPEEVRGRGALHTLQLVEPMTMRTNIKETVNPIRFEEQKPLLIAGLGVRYDCDDKAGIPGQWREFGPWLGRVPGQAGAAAYGVCSNFDDEGNFDYLCGVEVKDFNGLPEELARLRIAPQRYAVFAHREHVSSIGGTWNAVWNQWLPESGFDAVDGPHFEKYDDRFNPMTGLGGFEIWIPVRKK